jgi:hypothetical protein
VHSPVVHKRGERRGGIVHVKAGPRLQLRIERISGGEGE